MAPDDLAPHSLFSRQRALLLIGNLVFEVTGPDLYPARAALKNLAAQFSRQADASPYPTVGEYLPAAGRVRNSERFLLGPVGLARALPGMQGDWVGFNLGAEAELARYRVSGEEAVLILISYPTPQVAARRVPEIARAFAANPAQRISSDRPAVFLRRTSSLVAVVAQTSSQSLADSLLANIHYQDVITWNEPRHTLTDPPWSQVVVGMFVGTGIVMLFAIVAGIGFGGIRLLVKFLLPGKVFDRPNQVEILQLGISSKPIEAKDFY